MKLNGTGRFPATEQPEEVNALIEDFIAALYRTGMTEAAGRG